MPLYLGTEDSGTTGSSLQDFAPTGLQKMSAAVRESWLESYGPAISDYLRGVNSDDRRKITASEAEAMRMGIGGGARVSIKPKDNEYTVGQWSTILERQRELAAVKDVRERTPWEMGSILRGTAMFGAGIADPINLATAFVPWTRSITALRGVAATAETGATLAARTGARAILGGADAGISTAILEPLNYAVRRAIGDDYTAMDSMANIAFGTAFGGGLHVIGGGVADAFRGRFSRVADPAPADVAPAPDAPVVDRPAADAPPLLNDAPPDAPRVTPEAERMGMPELKGEPEARIEFVPEKVQQAVDAEVGRLRAEIADAARVSDAPAAAADAAPTDAPAKPARAGKPAPRNDLLAAMKKAGGISVTLAREATGENGMRLNRGLPGLVRKQGGFEQYDQAAQLLADEGFLTPGIDPLSYEAAYEAEDLISRALNGERIVRWETRMQEDMAARYDMELASAADVVESLSPETREAALRAAVAQALDGRAVDVEPIIGMDDSLQMNTIDDVAGSVDRGFDPESQPLADFEVSRAVDERNAAAPKWQMLEAADQALAEADALLADTLKAGEEAWRYSRQRQTDTEAFKKWFGDSKVVGADGEPLVVYHGTGTDFAEFDMGRLGESTRHSSAALGSFFTADPAIAAQFAGQKVDETTWPVRIGYAAGANVMPVRLAIQSPLEMTAREFAARFVRGKENAKAFREKAVSDGHDGVRIVGDKALGDSFGGDEYGADAWVAFRPEQIKSATGNRGTFDPNDPSILYARGITGQSAADELTAAIAKSFGDSTETMLARGQVQIVPTPAEIPGGPHPADVKAATSPDGKVYIVAENVSPAEARGIVLHEVGVHVGMREMLGDDLFGTVLTELDDAILRGESWAQSARAAVPADTPASLVREEQLAYLVQNAPELPIVQKIMAAVRAWAYRTFEFARDRMTLTEADFRALAVSAVRAAADGGWRITAEGMIPFSRDVGQTETKAFRDWFGGSKVVGADGGPLVVYHGTQGEFTVFDYSKIGQQGRAEGAGFYFTNNQQVASGYGKPMEVFLSIRKPLAYDAKGFGKPVVQKIVKRVAELESQADGNDIADGFLANFGDVRSEGLQSVIRQAADMISGDETALDQLSGIVGSGVNPEHVNKATRDVTGHDGVVANGFSNAGDRDNRIFVAFFPEQIKSATGNNGQFDPKNPDIRYSRGPVEDPSTAQTELTPYDEAVARAKDYAKVLRAAADKLANDADATAAMRAALPDITKQEIDNLLGQLRKEVKGLRGITRASREALTADDRATIMQPDAMKAADTLANNLQMAAIIERRNAALNQNVRLKAASFINQFRKPGLDFEGFRALLVGSERKRDGARLSVEAEQKQFRGEWLGGMIADLEKAGQWQAFGSGAFDRDVFVALHAMGKGEQPAGVAPEAVKIAEIVNKYQEDARNTRNRFGAWIRDLSGYVTRQTHDTFKIRDAGQAEWVKTVLPLLDIPKMQRLGLISEADPARSLADLFGDFAAGRHMKTVAGEDDMAAFGAGRNLAKRESASRVLYFKDGDAAFQYNTKFGQGRLAETVLQGLDGAAKSAGLLKNLGTNPEATLDRLFMEYEDSLRGDPERRAAFASKKGELKNLLATLDGTTNIPGNVQAAKIAAFSRAWMTMAKLGGMLISSITDLSNYAAEMRFGQDKNLLSGVLDGMGSLTRGRAKGEQKQILASLGVFHESMLGGAYHRFDNPDLMGGKTAAAMQTFFKWTGINWWTETLRDAYALSHSHYMASNSGKAFDALPEALRDMLGLYKVDAGKWELLRTAPLKAADGRNYMTPEGVNTLPRQALENYITSVGRTVTDTSVQNLRDDLASALRAMTIDRMHHAVIEPGARTRAFMQRGTQPGTVPGEFLRYIGQFKSFPVALVQMTLGREVYGRGYDTLGEYMKKGKGDMLGMASFLALSVGMGYAAMSIKDLLKGKNPRPVDDYRTWMAAFVQGGGLGIYGDFLFGQQSRTGGGLTASLAGPVFGAADTIMDIKTRLQKGDDVAAASFKAALDNTPFMNLFYTRIALDYLILHQIQEALNPGFLRRMEQRAKRDNGQTYWLPPSERAR